MKSDEGTNYIRIISGLCIALAVVVAVFAVLRLDTTGRSGSGLSREFTYDVNELAWVDPNLILYEESGQSISTGFSGSRGIAVDSNDSIYVVGDEAVHIFTDSGKLLGEIGLSGRPQCMTVSAEGVLYVGMEDHVEVYDAAGKRLASWESLGDRAVLTSIAVWKDNVFVADAGNRVVVRYDTAGKFLDHIGKRDAERNIPGFVIPSPYFDLAVGGDGLLRVVNPGRHRIEAYTFDGDLEFWWGKQSVAIEGFCGCCNPVNFALLPHGGFVTSEKGLVRVKVYDSDGGFVGVVAGPAQLVRDAPVRICTTPAECQAGGFDVAAGADGRVYVLDAIRNHVRIFSRKGPAQ